MGLDKLCAVVPLSLKDVEEFLTVGELLIVNFTRELVTVFKTACSYGYYDCLL